MSYKEILTEIKEIQSLIEKHNKGETMPPDFNYKKTISRLSYLRNRKRQLHKSDRGHSQYLEDDV